MHRIKIRISDRRLVYNIDGRCSGGVRGQAIVNGVVETVRADVALVSSVLVLAVRTNQHTVIGPIFHAIKDDRVTIRVGIIQQQVYIKTPMYGIRISIRDRGLVYRTDGYCCAGRSEKLVTNDVGETIRANETRVSYVSELICAHWS